MTFIIPTPVHLMQNSFGSDARARGDFTEGTWSTKNTKSNGSLPLTGSAATQFVNSTTNGFQGAYWEFKADGGYDVSSNTKVVAFTYQYNAPNRLELDTTANNGIVLRAASGSNSPPTNYLTYQIGGRDSSIGKAREFPVHMVLDLNDTTSNNANVGTYDNTNVESIGFGSTTREMGGTTTQLFFQRMFVFDTVKGGDSTEPTTDIPRFVGVNSNWDDIITAMGKTYADKITHGWLAKDGTTFSVACPLEFGDNSTETTFDDGGVSVLWPNSNEIGNPSTRVTYQAFRVYTNLRDNAADSATFSGIYNCGNSHPPWDFNQNDAAIITFNGPSFNHTGTFLLGNSVSGFATFNSCDIIKFVDNEVDLTGSTFTNPHSTHLLELTL